MCSCFSCHDPDSGPCKPIASEHRVESDPRLLLVIWTFLGVFAGELLALGSSSCIIIRFQGVGMNGAWFGKSSVLRPTVGPKPSYSVPEL